MQIISKAASSMVAIAGALACDYTGILGRRLKSSGASLAQPVHTRTILLGSTRY